MQPTTHHEAVQQLHQKYEQGVQTHEYIPFTYPMTTYGALLLLLFFLIPPYSRLHTPLTRYVTFFVASAFHVFLISKTRGHAMAVAFGIGLISAWGVVWSAVVLIFHDGKREFSRVKKVGLNGPPLRENNYETETQVNQYNKEESSIHRRKADSVEKSSKALLESNGSIPSFRGGYIWQRYPTTPCYERFDWSIDLLSNFRGVGWDWKVAGLPSRPPIVQRHLHQNSRKPANVKDVLVSRNGIARLDSSHDIIRHNVWLLIKGYMFIDLCKVLINRDPYFWGQVDCHPPQYLPMFIQTSAFLLRGYRLLVSMSMVWLILRTIFSLGPIFFVGVMGPEYLGSNGEPWMYADHYGSYVNVLDRGLAGWWGGWWHQTFRFAFESAGNWVVTQLEIDATSITAKIVKLLVAFSISGCLHGCGSVTMLGETSPWTGMFLFFLLQPVGIILELAWKMKLKQTGISNRIPRWVSWIFNFTYAHMWLYFTGPLLADDFARGGLWLLEPLMFSPLRGLGFGAEGDGFFCWNGRLLAWHRDSNYWWLSGIAL